MCFVAGDLVDATVLLGLHDEQGLSFVHQNLVGDVHLAATDAVAGGQKVLHEPVVPALGEDELRIGFHEVRLCFFDVAQVIDFALLLIFTFGIDDYLWLDDFAL